MTVTFIVVVAVSCAVGLITGWVESYEMYTAWQAGRRARAVWLAVMWVAVAAILGGIIGTIGWLLS